MISEISYLLNREHELKDNGEKLRTFCRQLSTELRSMKIKEKQDTRRLKILEGIIAATSNEMLQKLKNLNIEQSKLMECIIKQLLSKSNDERKLKLSTVSSKPVFTDSDISLTEIEDALNIQKNKDFNILEDFDQSILDFNESLTLNNENDNMFLKPKDYSSKIFPAYFKGIQPVSKSHTIGLFSKTTKVNACTQYEIDELNKSLRSNLSMRSQLSKNEKIKDASSNSKFIVNKEIDGNKKRFTDSKSAEDEYVLSKSSNSESSESNREKESKDEEDTSSLESNSKLISKKMAKLNGENSMVDYNDSKFNRDHMNSKIKITKIANTNSIKSHSSRHSK